MISYQVIYPASDQPAAEAREVRAECERISIGFPADCDIRLPAVAAAPLRANIFRSEDGILRIEAQGGSFFEVDGASRSAAALVPGQRIRIGECRIDVLVPRAGIDLSLSLTPGAARAEDDDWRGVRPLSIAELGISKRRLGIALAALVLVAFVLLPSLPLFSAAFDGGLARPSSPAPLSRGHTGLADKCSSCHTRPFVAVADAACQDCHHGTRLHSTERAAHDGIRCADCHPTHAAKAAATPTVSARCVACHARQAGLAGAGTRDFGSAHPPFRPAVIDGADTRRIAPATGHKPTEQPGIKFSHATHLTEQGLSTPNGDIVLGCRDCHRLDDAGERFMPMRMEQTCQQSRCHKLRFSEPVVGLIPHGAETAIMDRLRNIFIRRIAETPTEAQACGSGAGGDIRRAVECADRLAEDYASKTLFRDSGEALQCGLCHEMRREDSPKVMPVRIGNDRLPAVRFPHGRHATYACSDCHEKRQSKTSSEVALPLLEKCRECHGGRDGDGGRLATNCESCHRFHRLSAVTP